MPMYIATAQQTYRHFSEGRAAHSLTMGVASLCAAFYACSFGGTSLQIGIDTFLLSLCVLGFFLDPRNTKNTDKITNVNQLTTTTSLIDKAMFDSRCEACCAVSVKERASHRKRRNTHCRLKAQRSKSDVYIVERAQREGVTHELPEVLEVMHSSVRLGHGDAAVMLFDQMLNKGPIKQFLQARR